MNTIVLQTFTTPFSAAAAATEIAGRIDTPGAGVFL